MSKPKRETDTDTEKGREKDGRQMCAVFYCLSFISIQINMDFHIFYLYRSKFGFLQWMQKQNKKQ